MQTVYLLATRMKGVLESGKIQEWQMHAVTNKDKIANYDSWHNSEHIEVKIFEIQLPLDEAQ